MKFSLSFFERPAPAAVEVVTGRAIKSTRVEPWHAKALQDLHGLNRRMLRMYESAITDRLNADFAVSQTSANAEILTSAIAARSRARRLERDNPYAVSILTAFQNNVAGDDPFRLQMHLGKRNADGEFIEERETNQLIEDWWEDAGMPENFTVRRDMSRLEAYLQAVASLVRDGGILWRKHRAFPKNKYRYAVETLEVDRLDHNFNRPRTGTQNGIQFGIELDEWEGPIAFWILTRHPGDVTGYSGSYPGSNGRFRQQISSDEIIALWDIRTRAGQYVGMPRFSSIIQRLHRLDQYDIAEITAAIWASCKPFFLTRKNTSGDYSGDEQTEAGEKVSVSEPATGEILPDGYEPVLVDPKHPTEAYPAFTKTNLRAAGVGSGIAYHTLAGDLEAVNFSSGRMGENQQRDEFKKLQKHMILNLVRPDFNERLRYAILSGELQVPLGRLEEIQRAAVFHGKRWPYVNPLQDAQADVLRIEKGLDSRQRVVAESDRGGTFEDVCDEQSTDNAFAEDAGLDFNREAGAPVDGEDPAEDPPAAPAKTGGKKPAARNRFHRRPPVMHSANGNGRH